MKKSLIFASLIAVVALLATSCKEKVEKPTARFSYTVDGMVVTFANATKGDVESYAWNFGDNETSTEKDPVHTYAKAGTYTVSLTAKNAGGENTYTEEIVLAKALIVVDGDFADWAEVPADKLAQASTDENTKYEALYNMKWCADDDYLYFYVEFTGETYERADGTTGYLVDPIDIYMNVDGDQTTGSNSYLWENSAADYLIEGFWSNNYEDAGVYSFPADADQTAWAWVDAEVAGSTSTCDIATLANGHKAIEGQIIKAMIPSPIVGLKVGMFSSNTDWKESGCLPQTTINDDGTSTPSPLLEVKL